MFMSRLFILLLLAPLGLALVPQAEAQGIFDRARRAAERGAERAVEREAQRRADRAVTGAIECALGDRECARQAEEEGREVVYVDGDGQPTQAAAPGATAMDAPGVRPGDGAWANYDFVPGERPLFVDDFSSDTVGRFPRRLGFERGAMEVVEWEGRTLLRSTDSRSVFSITLPETLPDRFTIEFDAFFTSRRLNDVIGVSTTEWPRNRRISSHSTFYLSPRNAGVQGPVESLSRSDLPADDFVAVRISVDGDYVAMYLDERRVANIPNADIPRTNQLHFRFGQHSEPSFLDNIRVAAGGREMMYDRLIADGRLATQGILFGTASATIRPESTPTLQDIAQMMQQNADLRLRIEGHTDSVGNADANQRLSEQRAQAVVAYLTGEAGIASDRLESAGMGQSSPVADNGTAEGRAQNRRVELVVL